MLRLHINWIEVCKIENEGLRGLIASCTDEKVLQGLMKGFPKLFVRRPRAANTVPWSAIVTRAREYWATEMPLADGYTSEEVEHSAAESWNVALAGHQGRRNVRRSIKDGCFPVPDVALDIVPDAIMKQMIGQTYGWDGVRIMWRGEEHVVSYSQGRFSGSIIPHEWKDLIPGDRILSLEQETDSFPFRMVATRFIDFTK